MSDLGRGKRQEQPDSVQRRKNPARRKGKNRVKGIAKKPRLHQRVAMFAEISRREMILRTAPTLSTPKTENAVSLRQCVEIALIIPPSPKPEDTQSSDVNTKISVRARTYTAELIYLV